jgi:hypothetical protein
MTVKALLIALLIFSPVSSADYVLEVWEKNVPRSQPPLARKVYIALSDCNREREWLAGLFYRLGTEVWITCDYGEKQ